MKNGGQRKPRAWVSKILSEEVQRSFLVLSGCIIFILGAFVLSLDSPSVPYEIRVYSWENRLEGQTTQVRALGFDRKKHGFLPVSLCREHPDFTPTNAASDGYALPLILEAKVFDEPLALCLKIGSHETREFTLNLPAALGSDDYNQELQDRESEIYAAQAYPKFPFTHYAIPEEGVYNPMNPEAKLLFWLDSKNVIVRHEREKGNFVEADRGKGGIYKLPMENRGLIGKTVVQVQRGEELYSRELRFHPRARETTLEVESAGDQLKLKLQLVNESLSHTHDDENAHVTKLFCSLMSGSIALHSVVVTLSDDKPIQTAALPHPIIEKSVLSIVCDPNPLGGDSDSVSTWVVPPNSEGQLEPFLTLMRKSLPKQMKRSMAKKLLGWYRYGSGEEKKRATKLLLAASKPAPTTMKSIATSFPDDFARATSEYKSLRNQIFAVLSLLLFLWLLMTLINLWHRRQLRTLAIQDYLSDDPDEDVAVELMMRGKDALARPRSNLIALAIVMVLLCHILGLLWVLWSL